MIRRMTIIGSLALALASIALWIGSYGPIPHLVCQWQPKRCAYVIAVDGEVWFQDLSMEALRHPRWWVLGETVSDPAKRRLYYGHFHDVFIGSPRFWEVPIWPFVASFGAYPTLVLIARALRRWRRRRKGYCVTCAYDLTGNVTGVCPECGEAV